MPYGCSTILFEIAFNIGQQFFEGRHMIFVRNNQGQGFTPRLPEILQVTLPY
jgi:hypothetical protein